MNSEKSKYFLSIGTQFEGWITDPSFNDTINELLVAEGSTGNISIYTKEN